MVTPLCNVFGMDLEFALTAMKLGICNTLATSYDVTNDDLTLTCCIAYSANNRATRRLIATHFHLTSEGFPSLVSLGTNRGVMLQISSFYFCYRFIFVIDLSLLLLFHFCYLCYLSMIWILFYCCYLL